MSTPVSITVAKGDGIGPEIMDACLHVLQEAGASLHYDLIEVGEKVYLSGNTAGISAEAFETIRRNKVFFKAPITTPQGGGYKSLNVTTRKTFGLYCNLRPCRSLHPFVDTKHPVMDVVIVRENEEDLYAGIEYRQSPEAYAAIKLITRPGCERIVRYAFEYARKYNRKKVTCFSKDNIMKFTDGLFHKVFDEIAAEYTDIENEHWIVDIGAAKLADSPEAFDVLVMPNLYGDILSDVAAQISGSVGLAGSANIGEQVAMFEAIHGSAPRRAGQNMANPSGLLQGGILMLLHLGMVDTAERVQNAWLRTIEDGVHTYDIYAEGKSTQKVGTKEFAQAVAARLGQKPEKLAAANFQGAASDGSVISTKGSASYNPPTSKDLKGVDVFVQWTGADFNDLGKKMETLNGEGLKLLIISNRGQKIYPGGARETYVTDTWICRYMAEQEGANVSHAQVVSLLSRVDKAGLDFVKTENLYTFDGAAGYTLAQGQ